MDIKQAMLNSAPIIEMMDKHGLTLEYLVKKLKTELTAKETKFFAHQGEIIEQVDVIAWGVRQKAREDAHKLRGDYAPEKHEHSFSEDLIEALQAAKEKARSGNGSE